MPSLEEQLVSAAHAGDITKLAALLSQRANINYGANDAKDGADSSMGPTPLLAACQAEQEEAALFLLEHKAIDVNAPSGDRKETALHAAARNAMLSVTNKLISLGANVDAKDFRGDSPLLSALQCSEITDSTLLVIKALVEAGADINARRAPWAHRSGKPGPTALEYAISDPVFSEITLYLLENGADTSGLAEADINLSSVAPKALKRVLEKSPELLTVEIPGILGGHHLHGLALFGSRESIKIFIDAARSRGIVDIVLEARNRYGFTPLLIAATNGNDEGLALLMAEGADLTALAERGLNALRCASRGHGHGTTVRMLIETGCFDINEDPEIDREVAWALKYKYLPGLFSSSNTPIDPERRVLQWVVRSPTVSSFVRSGKIPPMPAARDEKEAAEVTAMRLKPLKDDAWKRRRHLCIDRALWQKPAPAVAQTDKPAPETAMEA
jgi:uncharacterized protein